MTEESALQEAAQEFQRCVAESLDNLLDVHQRMMAACKVAHGEQQQQQQEDQQGCVQKRQGNRHARAYSIHWHPELEETRPALEAMRAISIPGICDTNEEETPSVSPSSLSNARVVPATLPESSPMRKQFTGPLWGVSICRASTDLCNSEPCCQVSEEVNKSAPLPFSAMRPQMSSPHQRRKTPET